MSVPESDERRFALRLLDYWQVVRGEREFPKPEEIDLDALGRDAVSVALIELANRPEDALFRYLGPHLKPAGWLPCDQTGNGRTVAEVPGGSLLHELLRSLPQVINRPVPLSLGGAFALGGRPVLGRSILLPLSTDGVRATHLLGGITYRYTDQMDRDDIA